MVIFKQMSLITLSLTMYRKTPTLCVNNTYIADFSRKLYIYVRYSNHRMAPPSVIILADPLF